MKIFGAVISVTRDYMGMPPPLSGRRKVNFRFLCVNVNARKMIIFSSLWPIFFFRAYGPIGTAVETFCTFAMCEWICKFRNCQPKSLLFHKIKPNFCVPLGRAISNYPL